MIGPLRNKLKLWQNKIIVMLSFCMSFFNLSQLPAAKKTCKNRASQQTFGPSYFVMALQSNLHEFCKMQFFTIPKIRILTMAGFLDSSPKSLKYEFWILKFFMGLNYSWLLVLSYGISHIHLKSCGLTQESAEDDPFSTFCLIWTNSISRKVRKKIIIPKPGNFGIKTQLFLDQMSYGH